jgi:hypothetical protein
VIPKDSRLEPEWRAFFRPWGVRHPASPDTRRRALACARACVGVAPAIPPSVVSRRASVVRWHGWAWVGAAASLVVAVGAIAGVATLRDRAAYDRPNIEHAGRQSVPAARVAKDDPSTAAPVQAAGDMLAAELDLLRRARGAYRQRDFSGALRLVAEHDRRFSQGHLAEEREALRVRSLAGAGRAAEARRAAAAFAARFPRSVLLSRVTQESDSAE